MANNFSWNNDNFIEYFVKNRKAVQREIMAAYSVEVFEKIFSANQLLFYAQADSTCKCNTLKVE